MKLRYTALGIALAIGTLCAPAHALVLGRPVHGLALYGEPKYGPDFKNFEYVNPDAPKGGSIVRASIGTFDSFNAFTFKGAKPSPAILQYSGNGSFFYFNEPLMARGADEPMALYCLICETVEVAPDRKSIEYTLRPEARFHDGSPITPEDVIFSLQILMTKGHPRYKLYWGDVTRSEKTGDRKVRFYFKDDKNTELPMLTGELPVLSKKFWEARDFEAGTLDIPIASGPYRIDRFEAGRFYVLKRDPNYWGKDLPVTRGAHNFDEIRIDYYRDDDVAFQAFMNGSLDMRAEVDITRWATGYDQSLIDSGAMVKEGFADGQPDEIHPFVMNTRRPLFSDIRARRALSLAFDFDGTNRTVAYNLMGPFSSFWQGADLASSGLPQGEELAILESFRGRIPDEVFTQPFTPPRTDKEGALRQNLLEAQQLLAAAGWNVKDGALTNANGEQFTFEFLLRLPVYERWIGPYLQNLQRLGIKGTLRVIDPTQYLNRMNDFDFDMTLGEQPLWGGESDSPGNEQREQWGSVGAEHHGSENWPGIRNPAIDELIERLIKAQTRESLVAHTHALDRILLWNYYVVPGYVEPEIWWAYWKKLGRPAMTPTHGPNPALWWYDAAGAAKVEAARASRSGDGTHRNGLLIGSGIAAAVLAGLYFAFRRRRG